MRQPINENMCCSDGGRNEDSQIKAAPSATACVCYRKTMAGYGAVRLKRGRRDRIIPTVTHDRVEPTRLVAERALSHDRLAARTPDHRQPVKDGAFRAPAAL